jgi:hypothetical protein
MSYLCPLDVEHELSNAETENMEEVVPTHTASRQPYHIVGRVVNNWSTVW